MKTRVFLIGWMVLAGTLLADTVVYQSAWEKPGDAIGPEWTTNGQVEITPNGKRTILANLGQRQASLHLKKLPAHEVVRIECDLIVRGSWDGNISPLDNDRIRIWVDDGREFLNATFSNHPAWRMEKLDPAGEKLAQTFPLGHDADEKFKSRSGAAEVESLGYRFWNEEGGGYVPLDAVYRFVFLIPHRATSLKFNLRCHLTDDKYETQDAGLDKVVVTVLEEEVSYPAKEWSALVKALEGKDRVAGHRAMWQMLASPSQVRSYLGMAAVAEDDSELYTLIGQLSAEEFKVRSSALDRMMKLPAGMIGKIRAISLVHDDPETVVRLKQVIAGMVAEAPAVERFPSGEPFKDRLRELVEIPERRKVP